MTLMHSFRQSHFGNFYHSSVSLGRVYELLK